jgi:hypothetical protein
MLTPAVVLASVVPSGACEGSAVCVIWRNNQSIGWDYVCRAPSVDVERIIMLDQFDRGTKRRDYQVTREPQS